MVLLSIMFWFFITLFTPSQELSKYPKIIKLDPAAYKITVGKVAPKNCIAINCNFYEVDTPIGIICSINKLLKHIDITSSRPAIAFTSTGPLLEIGKFKQLKKLVSRSSAIIQAGPLLIHNSKIYNYSNDKYDRNVFSETAHTAIGITKYGKIILLYSRNTTLSAIQHKLIALGVIEATNLDGGSSSSLVYDNRVYGSKHVNAYLIFTKK